MVEKSTKIKFQHASNLVLCCIACLLVVLNFEVKQKTHFGKNNEISLFRLLFDVNWWKALPKTFFIIFKINHWKKPSCDDQCPERKLFHPKKLTNLKTHDYDRIRSQKFWKIIRNFEFISDILKNLCIYPGFTNFESFQCKCLYIHSFSFGL